MPATPQAEFFARPMYHVEVTGWPADLVRPADPIEQDVTAPAGARVQVWQVDPADPQAMAAPTGAGRLLDADAFDLRNSGNRTLSAPKRSWKFSLDGDANELAQMSTVNLKSMWNDPSQMREALVWRFFRDAQVPASRHTYARLRIDGDYLGLYSVIEEIDKPMLRQHFPGKPKGNLYKMYCGDLGPATLEHRVGARGDDSGVQYSITGQNQTYRLLKSYSDAPDAAGFADLAQLVRVVNGVGMPGGTAAFSTDGYASAVREILDVERLLRWAGVNVLVGAWDNYFATPANYFLYNSTRVPDEGDVVGKPYFTLVPWDYDNTLGMDYFTTRWQDTDLLDWAANTGGYWGHNAGNTAKRSRIPLVQNVLANRGFRRYYLDHVEHLLDTVFTVATVDRRLGLTGDPGLWQRVATSAYLESATPQGPPATGRQWANHEVYLNGFAQWELRHGETFANGIHHYVLMRYESARRRLAELRRDDPSGSSGASFPVAP